MKAECYGFGFSVYLFGESFSGDGFGGTVFYFLYGEGAASSGTSSTFEGILYNESSLRGLLDLLCWPPPLTLLSGTRLFYAEKVPSYVSTLVEVFEKRDYGIYVLVSSYYILICASGTGGRMMRLLEFSSSLLLLECSSLMLSNR